MHLVHVVVLNTEGSVQRHSVWAGHVNCLDTSLVVDYVKLHSFSLFQETESVTFDLRLVDEDWTAARRK